MVKDRFTMNIIKVLCLAAVMLGASACMGGGTMGTGLVGGPNGFGQGGDFINSNQLQFSIKGRLLGTGAAGIKGAHISAKTASNETHAVTNADGNFNLPVAINSGEEIIFLVTAAGKKSFCTTSISPAGETEVKADFKLSPGGKLTCPQP